MRVGFICACCKKYISCEVEPSHNCKKEDDKRSSRYTINAIIPAGWGSREIFDIETGRMIDDVEIKHREANGKLLLGDKEIEQECNKNKAYREAEDKKALDARNEELKAKIIDKLTNNS